MRLKPFIWVGILLSLHPAYAIKGVNDPKVIKAIQDQIYAANRMVDEIGKAQEKVDKAESEKSSPEIIARLKRQVQREKDKQSAARTKAIHMTLAAYDLWPESRTGTSVMPLTKGRTIHWQPVGRALESREVQNAKGDPRHVKQPDIDSLAFVYQDGVTYLVPEAFEKGPGFLASILLHERIHFEQMTTPGKGDKWTASKLQEEAFRWQVTHSEFFFDQVKDEALIKGIESRWKEEKSAMEQEEEELKTFKGRVRRILKPSTSPGFLDMRLHTAQELEEMTKQARELEGIVAEELEAVRREGEKERSRRAERLRDESLQNIRAAADFSCQVGLIYQERLDFPRVSDQPFYCKSDPGWSSDDNCQARIYSMLLGQLCQSGAFDPDPINEMRNRVYGPQPGIAPPVTGTNPTLPLDTVEASVPPFAERQLRDLALKACADPGGVTSADREALSWFPDRKLFMPDSVWVDLKGCARDLLERLVELNRTLSKDRTLDLEWLKAEARRLGEKHSPPPSDPDSGDGRDSDRDRGGNRVGDGNGPARDQAGRIGRGGKWPR